MTVEIERYELLEDPRYRFAFDRRDFIKTLGGGLLVLLVAPRLEGQESGRARGHVAPDFSDASTAHGQSNAGTGNIGVRA